MFEILEFQEAKIAVQIRSEKHGDEDVPAVTLGFEITGPNTMLDQLCPGLRHALFKAVEGQEELPGVEPSTPVLRSNVIDIVKLTTVHEGWRVLIDDGIDETTPMALAAGKLDKFTIEPKQGGSTVYRFKYGTSDVDEQRLGKLGMHNGQSVWIKVLRPEKAPPVIDGSTEAFKADHPELFTGDQPTPEDALAHAVQADGPGTDDQQQEDGEGSTTDAAAQARGSEGWPFPKPETERSAEDQAAAEQAELEAGMSQALAGAGVKPKRGKKVAA